jgi:hypothetical protein
MLQGTFIQQADYDEDHDPDRVDEVPVVGRIDAEGRGCA